MGRGRDREPRRRDFDDDYRPPSRPQSQSRPPRAPVSVGEPQDAIVKWFKPEKGFGFVELSDGSGDAFLHINTLEVAGVDSVVPGTQLSVQVSQGAKGPQVAAVLSVGDVVEQAAPARRPAAPRAPQRPRGDISDAESVSGVVKWFNATKGFGFIQADDGLKDIFVHVSVVSQAGMDTLHEGQRVNVKAASTQKGREAVSIESAD